MVRWACQNCFKVHRGFPAGKSFLVPMSPIRTKDYDMIVSEIGLTERTGGTDMSVRFVIGRAGSGKTEACLNALKQALKEDPAGDPFILLVPEQATFQAEYTMIQDPDIKGMIRGQVLSFRRLAYRIMQETGGTARVPMDDMGKKMLLYKLVKAMQDDLGPFHKLADQMGFIDKCMELFKEFRRYAVTAEDLALMLDKLNGDQQSVRGLGFKLQDIEKLYRHYEIEMGQTYLDAEDCLDMLADQLKDSPYAKRLEIWIDGFHGFTPQELRAVMEMAKHTKQVVITLCLDRDYAVDESVNELDLFYQTALTMIRLKKECLEQHIELDNTVDLNQVPLARFKASPMLQRLEYQWNWRHPLDASAQAGNDSETAFKGVQDPIMIYEAQNRRAEVAGIARDILRHVRDKGYRYRDIAIMVRNMTTYEDLISAEFRQLNIPFFMDQKRTVLHHPLTELIRSSLEVIQHYWPYEALFRALKTDFFLPLGWGVDPDSKRFAFVLKHCPEMQAESLALKLSTLDRHAIDELENIALAYGAEGYRWTDLEPWHIAQRSALDTPDAEFVPNLLLMEHVHIIRLWAVYPLMQLQDQLKHASGAKEMIQAVYTYLETLGVPERLTYWSQVQAEAGQADKAKEHAQLWDRLMDMFDQVVELMGDQPLTLEAFSGLLDKGFEGMKLALVPPALDQIFIGSMERSRAANVKLLYVLGVNDGVLPTRIQEEGIFTERERELLHQTGLELAPSLKRRLLDEQFLIYTTLTMASERLCISYPIADEEGKSLLPSEVIRRMKQWFPQLCYQVLLSDPNPSMTSIENLEYIEQSQGAVSYLIAHLQYWLKGADVPEVWWQIYHWVIEHPHWKNRLEKLAGSLFYVNQERPLDPEQSRKLYGDTLQVSVSRMERYTACPFSQFISHGLRLRERKVFRLEAPDIGQLFHAALNQMVMQVVNDQQEWEQLSDEDSRRLAVETVEQLAPHLQHEILLSSKRHQYIAGKLRDTVHQAFNILKQHALRSDFKPVGLEFAFGPGQQIPSLVFPLDNGVKLEVVGRIDRIDRADSDNGPLLRIIDYKSSETQLNLTELYYGLSLQMLTYLDVVLTHASQWLGNEARPAGVLYFHVHHPMMQTKNGLPANKAQEAVFKTFKMRGLVDADVATVKMMDKTLDKGHSELIPVGLKADGGFYANSSVATEQEWNVLRRYVRQTIRSIGTRLTEGHVAIEPYRLGKKTPCTFCSYKSICQFDVTMEGNQYHQLRPMSKQQVFEAIEQVDESVS